MRKLLLLTLSIAVLLLGLTACGGGDNDEDTAGETSGPSATEQATDRPTATATKSGSSNNGGGGGDALALEDYFERVEDVAIATDDKLTEIGDHLQNATYATEEEEIADVEDQLLLSGQTVETAVIDLSELEPPPEVQDAHDTFLEKLQAVLILQSQLLDDIESSVSTDAELSALFDSYDADLTETDNDFDDACFALQRIADDNDIDVDLRCG